MGMTMTQKILADHAGLPSVTVGQLINAKVDFVLGNDITGPVAIQEFNRSGFTEVFDPQRIALVMDHFAPNKDIKAAEQCKMCRDFAGIKHLEHFYDVGEMGIEHALLPEKGLVASGELIIGADSHTCTYGALGAFSTGVGSTDLAAAMATGKVWFKVPSAIKFILTEKLQPYVSGKDVILHIIGMLGVDGALYQSMEFGGSGLANLTMDDRLAMANMAIEAGAKNGIFEVDDITREYMKGRVQREYKVFYADDDAEYSRVIPIDLSAIEPTVAFPHLPENVRTPKDFGHIPIDQVVIGSCTNGRLSDIRIAAEIMKGRKVAKGVRVIVIPATQSIYKEAMKLGYLETLLDAGCAISTPTCGPCLGGHMGILAQGERCVATTNRNFVGRMGHTQSEIYLASPAVAAASAVTGKLTAPGQLKEASI
jgi:3-isopropylmalate/(R)-2-methylmalate dehydratase large subunit